LKRMTANLNAGVKSNLQIVKETLKLKNDNQAVAYLIAHFEASVDKITLKQDSSYRDRMTDMVNQELL